MKIVTLTWMMFILAVAMLVLSFSMIYFNASVLESLAGALTGVGMFFLAGSIKKDIDKIVAEADREKR